MLRSFQVTNFRSIRSKQQLLLMPSYRGTAPVVPVAAVFGANASGKSNLLRALSWMRDAVLDSYRLWEVDSGVPRSPYRLNAESLGQPSEFVVDIVLDGVQYGYGFSVTDRVVEEEWLHAFPHNRERVIFERHGQQVQLGSTVADRRGRAELLSSLLRDNALLLSTAVQAKQDDFMPVYRWFREGVGFAGARGRDAYRNVLAEKVSEVWPRHRELIDLVRLADFGITDLQVVVHDPVQADLSDPYVAASHFSAAAQRVALHRMSSRRELTFLHNSGDVALSEGEESDGTLAWLDLVTTALRSLDAGALLVVDELDASLHPRLSARLIELFRHPQINRQGAQLLFTTHDATLLGSSLGDDLLKRDEIWFVEKKDGETQLYPLSDFHPRDKENRERRYLAGSYGAVPAIFADSLVEAMLSTRKEPDAPA
jgi:hypothetical protein